MATGVACTPRHANYQAGVLSPPTRHFQLGELDTGVASTCMSEQSLRDQAREAVLKAIIKSAPTVGNSPAGVRDLAEAYALLERDLVPNAGVVQSRT